MNDQTAVDNRAIARLFASKDGKEVLAILNKRYVDKTIADPKRDLSEAYYNQGKADVIRSINKVLSNETM